MISRRVTQLAAFRVTLGLVTAADGWVSIIVTSKDGQITDLRTGDEPKRGPPDARDRRWRAEFEWISHAACGRSGCAQTRTTRLFRDIVRRTHGLGLLPAGATIARIDVSWTLD